MGVVRKLTNRVEFVVNYSALEQANRRIDDTKRASAEMERATQRAGQSASYMGAQYQESSRKADQNTESMRQNANQTASAAERVKQLERQLELQKSALRASTAGLSDMGRETDSLRKRASGLSDVVDLQKKKVSALKDQYAEMRGQAVQSGNALHRMRVRINEESAALGDLQGDLAKTTRSFNKLNSAENNVFKKSAKKYRNIGSNMRDAGEGLTNTFGYASLAVGGGLAYAGKKAMDFQQQMSSTKSVMDPKDVEKYSKSLEHLAIVQGAKTKYSALEAAQAEEELIKAGVSVSDIMHGALSGSLSLATAGELNLKDAAEVASTALNAFRKDHLSVAKAADILAGAANASATDVSELKYSLSMVSGAASIAGLSFKDTATALAVYAQHGIKGSDAGTSLKTMLLNLHPQTEKAASEFERLGLLTFDASQAMKLLQAHGIKPLSTDQGKLMDQLTALSVKMSGAKEGTKKQEKAFKDLTMQSGALHSAFYDQHGDLKKIDDIAQLLSKHLKGMTSEQVSDSLKTMFGTDGYRGAGFLFQEGAKGVDAMARAMDKIKAADVAAQKMKNLKGDVEQLRGSAETAGISMGNHLVPILDWFVNKGQKVVDWFNHLSSKQQAFITYTAVGTGALIGLAAGFGLFIRGVGAVAKGYGMLNSVIGRMTGRTADSTLSLAAQRREMEKNTVAAENLSRAEGNVGGVGSSVDIGGTGSASAKGKKGGFIKRLFKRGSASTAAETVEDVAQNASRGGRLLRTAGTGAKWLGRGVAGLGILASLTGLLGMTKGTAGSHIGDVLGSMGGTWGGAAGGAALGTLIMPGVGTAIGGGIGAAAGSLAGSAVGKWAGGKIQGMFKGGNDYELSGSIKAYEDLNSKATEQLMSLEASGKKISKSTASALKTTYSDMATSITETMKSHYYQDKDTLTSFMRSTKGISASEQNTILWNMQNSYKNQTKTVSRAQNRITDILDKARKEHRRLTAREKEEINALQAQMNDYAIMNMSKGAKEQRSIFERLKADSGKLSAQQAADVVHNARKSEKSAIASANRKYDKVVQAIVHERDDTHSISADQATKLIKAAQRQRDKSINSAKEMQQKVVSYAKKQAKGHVDQVDWETGKVLGFWDKMWKNISGFWNSLVKLFTGKSSGATFGQQGKKTTADTSSAGVYKSGAHAYATGTALGGHPGGNAILGDGGKPEFWFTPQGAAGLSPAVPTLYQNMPAGTQVLNGSDTERMLGAKAYAKGTNGFWNSIGDFLGKGFSWIKNGASSAANHLMKKAGVSVGDLGDLTQFTKKTAMPAVKNLISSGISNLAHSSDLASFKGVKVSGDVKQWIAAGMKLAGVKGASWAKGLATIAQRESGGNPNAVNNWDSNAKAGHPSAGLMQMIKSTFLAHAVKGHTSWMNPIDQVASSVRYIESRYGSISKVPGIASMAKGGKYVGYAKGTPGAGSWAEKVFGPRKKKDDPDNGGNGSIGVVSNRPITISAPVTINIKVDGGDANVADNIGRQVRDEIEKVFKNLTTFVDPGVIS
jgi:hypothetical protein